MQNATGKQSIEQQFVCANCRTPYDIKEKAQRRPPYCRGCVEKKKDATRRIDKAVAENGKVDEKSKELKIRSNNAAFDREIDALNNDNWMNE